LPDHGESHHGEEDASVCYRHPGRQSWILCQRCGRTICPECQIPAPVGVQCPECVREAGGGGASSRMPWSAPKNNVTAMRRTPKWQRWIGQFLKPDSNAPTVTWVLLGAIVLLFFASLFTGGALLNLLIAYPGQPVWQIWRFFTSAFAQPAFLNVVLNVIFFLLIGPTVERMLGRARFITVLTAGSAVGASAMIMTGSPAFGFSGAMFGMFAAYFIIGRQMGVSTRPFLIVIGLNLVLSLFISPAFIPMMIGGLLGGGGAAWLFFFHRDRARSTPRLPYLQIAGGVAVFIVVALLQTSILR